MKRFIAYLIVPVMLLNTPVIASSQTDKIFRTKHTIVHYMDDKDINDFIWRLGGGKFEFSEDTGLASTRIDRIVDKVKTILGMWIKTPGINVFLKRGDLKENRAAYYDDKTGAIYISVENASDGVFAHEVAHAVINMYFASPPPSQVQEILTQYVDKYLWSAY